MVKWSRIKTLLIALLVLGNTTSNASNLYRLIDGEILDALNIMSVENCNERTFSVNVKQKGLYYCNFWMLVPSFSDGRNAIYEVLVNGNYAGKISTSNGGWQSVCIDQDSRISLEKGDNAISVIAKGCEVPMIERISIGDNYQSAYIDSYDYKDYLEKAKMTQDMNEEVGQEADASLCVENESNMLLVDRMLPLNYSFYKIIYLSEGQLLRIKTHCKMSHSVDVFYIGQKIPVPHLTQNPTTSELQQDIVNNDRFKLVYRKASSEEMQGLAWKRNSFPNMDYTDFFIKIPKSGLYMVKTRRNGICNSITATISMMASDKLTGEMEDLGTYKDIPIGYSGTKCIIPANVSDFVVMTKREQVDGCDPMLFVEGNAGNRIVGFSDDSGYGVDKEFGISYADAYIEQKYKVKTSDVHIVNCWSLTPETSCRVICGIKMELLQELASPKKSAKNNSFLSIQQIEELIDNCCDNNWRQIIVYDASGKTIFSAKDSKKQFLIKSLKSGLYILKVVFDNGDYNVYKITIK